ncbi:PspC domain-containing protein [Erysipelothrix urinaevulpis]|uniref:PspC domain-containing protein n=1 Tax=Erysipelothrix urinaevulpis TaxID=2683717 RepID=UPI001356BC6F|nr:PspC domain-containing protein [Erysipelothrix urinaevulpis]
MAYHSNKRMYRDRQGAMVGGVCAGLSEYFKIDVTVLRILFAALVLAWGSGLLAYFVLWIVLPEKHDVY